MGLHLKWWMRGTAAELDSMGSCKIVLSLEVGSRRTPFPGTWREATLAQLLTCTTHLLSWSSKHHVAITSFCHIFFCPSACFMKVWTLSSQLASLWALRSQLKSCFCVDSLWSALTPTLSILSLFSSRTARGHLEAALILSPFLPLHLGYFHLASCSPLFLLLIPSHTALLWCADDCVPSLTCCSFWTKTSLPGS